MWDRLCPRRRTPEHYCRFASRTTGATQQPFYYSIRQSASGDSNILAAAAEWFFLPFCIVPIDLDARKCLEHDHIRVFDTLNPPRVYGVIDRKQFRKSAYATSALRLGRPRPLRRLRKLPGRLPGYTALR